MPRGGARVNSGPAPDPNALRRDRPSDAAGWTTLPAEGRGRKAAPKWPLLPDIGLRSRRNVMAARAEMLVRAIEDRLTMGDDTGPLEDKLTRVQEQVEVLDFQVAEQDGREKALWREVWRYPQAVIWERDHQQRAVAMFVRHQVLGELGSLDDAKEARQWSDRLGVNPTAMLRNRWRIQTAPAPEQRRPSAPAKSTASTVVSLRDRAKKLASGGGGA